MNEPIKVGDLVYAYRWPCCGAHLGKVFRVETFWSGEGWDVRCNPCLASVKVYVHGVSEKKPDGYVSTCPVEWLKKIKDFPELEKEWNEERIEA